MNLAGDQLALGWAALAAVPLAIHGQVVEAAGGIGLDLKGDDAQMR